MFVNGERICDGSANVTMRKRLTLEKKHHKKLLYAKRKKVKSQKKKEFDAKVMKGEVSEEYAEQMNKKAELKRRRLELRRDRRIQADMDKFSEMYKALVNERERQKSEVTFQETMDYLEEARNIERERRNHFRRLHCAFNYVPRARVVELLPKIRKIVSDFPSPSLTPPSVSRVRYDEEVPNLAPLYEGYDEDDSVPPLYEDSDDEFSEQMFTPSVNVGLNEETKSFLEKALDELKTSTANMSATVADVGVGIAGNVVSSADKTMESMKDGLESLNSLLGNTVNGIGEKLNGFKNEFSSIGFHFDFKKTWDTLTETTVFKSLAGLKDRFKDFMSTNAGKAFVGFVIAGFLWTYCRRTVAMTLQNFKFFSVVLDLLAPIGLGVALTWSSLTSVFEEISDYLTKSAPIDGDVFVEQADFKGTLTKNALIALFATSIPNSGTVLQKFWTTSSRFGKEKKGVESVIEFILELLTDVVVYLGKALDNDWLKSVGAKYPRIVEISDELSDISLKIKTQGFRMGADLNTKLVSLERELRTMLSRELMNIKENSTYRQQALSLLSEIQRLTAITAKGSGSKGKTKTESLSVALIGQPGTCKSTLNEFLIYDVTARVLDKERLKLFEANPCDEVFTVGANMEFWEGYTGQFAIRVDDILQFKDAPGMPNMNVTNLINMQNSAPYFPNYAALELKGMYEFTSRLLFLTDNNLKINEHIIKSINCVGAFSRRVDHCILAVPREQYCLKDNDGNVPTDLRYRKLDPKYIRGILKKEDGLDIRTIHDLYPYDWDAGKVKGAPMSYIQLRDNLVAAFKLKEEIGTAFVNQVVDNYKEAIRARREELEAEERRALVKEAEAETKRKQEAQAAREEVFEAEVIKAVKEWAADHKGVFDEKTNTVRPICQADIDNYEKVVRNYLRFDPRFKPQGWTLGLKGNEDPFKILGLDTDVGLMKEYMETPLWKQTPQLIEKVKAAYRAMSLKAHPDKGGKEEDMVKLNWAYAVLSDYKLFINYKALVHANATPEMRLESMLHVMGSYELLNLFQVIPEEKMDSYWRMVHFMIEGDAAYDKSCMPCDEFFEMMSQRLNIPIADIRMWYITHLPDVQGCPVHDYLDSLMLWWTERKNKAIDMVKLATQKVKEFVTSVMTYKYEIAAVTALLGVGYFAWKTWGDKLEPQTAKPVRPSKQIARAKARIRTIGGAPFTDQKLAVTDQVTSMWNGVRKNLYSMHIEDSVTISGWMVFVGKKMALGLRHMASFLEEYEFKYITLRSVNGDFSQKISVAELLENSVSVESGTGKVNEDFSIVNLPSFARDTHDILHFFLKRSSAEKSVLHKSHYGTLFKPKMDLKEGVWKYDGMASFAGYAYPILDKTYGSELTWSIGDGLAYDVATVDGDCGLPWVVTDATALNPFIGGIHCAGNGTKGLALCIYQDDLGAAMNHFYGEGTYVAQSKEPVLPPGWTKVKDIPYERTTGFSKLMKSKLYGKWSRNDKYPAKLRSFERQNEDGTIEVINPMYNAMKPYGVPKGEYNKELIKDLARAYAKRIIERSKKDEPWAPRLLGIEESIAGVEGVLKGIPRNTSAGYPWSKLSKKKYEFFGREGPYDFTSEKCVHLIETIKKQIEMLKRGETPDWVYMAFLKDELRSLIKVEQGKTRMVMGSPVDKTVIASVYFKDFYRWLQDNRIFNGIAIGINPSSIEWTLLRKFITSLSEFIIAGDFSNWDGNQPSEFDEGFLIVVEAYYYNATSEDRAVRRLIIEDTSSPKIAVTLNGNSMIAQVHDIEPSGDLSTGPKNSINNNLRSAYVRAHMLLQRAGLRGAMDYKYDPDLIAEVFKDEYIALGDDHLLNLCLEHAQWMTEKSYALAMSECHFGYTDARKTGFFSDGLQTIKEASFLKREFKKLREYPGRDFAVLDLDVTLQMAYWLEKGAPPGTTADTVDVTAKELAPHGFPTYREYAWPIAVASRQFIGHVSDFLPLNDSEDEIFMAWHRAIHGYFAMDYAYI